MKPPSKYQERFTLVEAAAQLKISDRALRYRIKRGHAIAIQTVGGYVMTARQIADAERRKPKPRGIRNGR